MYRETKYRKIDFGLLMSYLFLVIFGWLNIYSAVYTEDHPLIFDITQRYGMQFIWMCVSFVTAIFIIYIINPKIYDVLSPFLYGAMLLLLFIVIFAGKEVNGSKSWFYLGSFAFQPAEFSKITTALLLSYVMSKYGFRFSNIRDACKAALIMIVPIILIIAEKETGSALVYLGLIFVLYREGLNGWVLIFLFAIITLFIITIVSSPLVAIICCFAVAGIIRGLLKRNILGTLISVLPVIVLMAFLPAIMRIKFMQFLTVIRPEYIALILSAPYLVIWLQDAIIIRDRPSKFLIISFLAASLFVISVNFIFTNVLQPHQTARIESLLGVNQDLQGIGYNVHQSEIAIGSGGLIGKGFLHGTQTKYNFVPEQSTDFIFCTVGEEWGFVGSLVLIAVYIYLIIRILILSDKNPDNFARIYGYCVASIFFMHVFINLGMTMGIMPVIGIPLPFLSYGGSSMLSFTILLFIFIRLDMERQNR
ncbi:MAG: rod shape-determining protein RodA [Bacteroidales bacterium]|jgi:rod shape determining protein RodA|nr:rod shape-determining protein RodA [Bacteroidales bacterium]MCI1732966.1 rod shape-determining protein RodA [Bacteroidales bacterium]